MTVQAGDGYKVEMTPPNVVTPVVNRGALYFNINSDFETYKGEAGVLVTMPEYELEKVIASVSSTFNVLPTVIEESGDFYLEASTSATVYIQEIEDDDMDIEVRLLFAEKNSFSRSVIDEDEDSMCVAYLLHLLSERLTWSCAFSFAHARVCSHSLGVDECNGRCNGS